MPAVADEYDALNVLVGATITHDSNLFRVPDSGNPQSDTIAAGSVGLQFDKPYAQQRFQLAATETAYRYDRFSYLDFDAFNYRGAWLWHLTPRVNGTLIAARTEALVPFQDTTNKSRNVRTTDDYAFTLDGSVSGAWHALLGVSQTEQTSEQPSESTPDFRGVSGEVGVKYLASSGSWLSVVQRATSGEYLNGSVVDPTNPGVNDNYHQDESELQAWWILNAKSTVTGRLTWIDRRNDNFTQGDFSGLAGKLGYTWMPTAKLTLDFAAQRDIYAWQSQNPPSTYQTNNTVSFTPKWQVGAKVALRASLQHINSWYHGGPPSSTPARSDTTNNALIGADWLALRSLTISTSLQRQERSSSDDQAEFNDTLVNVGILLKF